MKNEYEIIFKNFDTLRRKRKFISTPSFEEAVSHAFTQKMIINERTNSSSWHILSVADVTDELI
jgi:hypothetical protein